MRKLFLTSGLVLCLAYPAFADIVAGTSTASCDESVLGSYTGPVDFVSDWRPMISAAITLNSNRYTGSNNSPTLGSTATTTATPTPLYAVYGVGVYSSQPTVGTLSNFTTSNRLTALTITPAVTGYTFSGFYTTPVSDGTQVIDANGNFIYTNNAASTQFSDETNPSTWYARWSPNSHTISYGCGSAPSGATESVTGKYGPRGQNVTYGSSYNLSTTYGGCALPGYHATGWDCTGGATLSNATGSQSTWTSDENISCTVHWVANSISLNYYQDENATTTFATDTCTYDGTFTLPTNYQPRPGYHFNGWNIREP